MTAKSPSVEKTLSFPNSSAISLREDAQVWLWKDFDFKSINRILRKKPSLLNDF